MFICRIGSFNELEQHRKRVSWRRWLGCHPLPSADELAYVSERINADSLRRMLGHFYSRLKRNKVLSSRQGHMLAAIDGHEIGSSYHRCCDCCMKRSLEVGSKTKVQYYHRIVVFQLVCGNFNFLMDLELQRAGEDEVSAAMRLLKRVMQNHPRCFDVLTADAIYLRPSMINFICSHGKHFIAVLKANQPELLAEAKTLMASQQPLQLEEHNPPCAFKAVDLRDMEGFTTENISAPLRIVWSHEHTVKRERIAGAWEDKEIVSDWFWATTIPQSLATTEIIAGLGHDRWKIENEGFNELVTHWHANHYFHHHPNSILVLWLVLFMAHAVFHCFHQRHLKPELRKHHTAIYFAGLIAADLRSANWWPPPPS